MRMRQSMGSSWISHIFLREDGLGYLSLAVTVVSVRARSTRVWIALAEDFGHSFHVHLVPGSHFRCLFRSRSTGNWIAL